MIRILFVQPDGATQSVEAEIGQSAMQAAVFNNVRGIAAECGGLCNCATCHVYVDPAWVSRLPALGPVEDDMLGFTAAERRPESRLACQLRLEAVYEGLVLHVPATQF